jgi:hypothetical protein
MSKRHSKVTSPPVSDGSAPLVVIGVRRKEPDWDGYVAALLSFALRTVEEENESDRKGDDK